jgi:hypothetical protein
MDGAFFERLDIMLEELEASVAFSEEEAKEVKYLTGHE